MDDTLELALVDPSNTKSYQDDKQNTQFSNAGSILTDHTKRGMNSVTFGTITDLSNTKSYQDDKQNAQFSNAFSDIWDQYGSVKHKLILR